MLSHVANRNGFYYHNQDMENQRKANFLIVVFVLSMHVLLFWAIAIHSQKIDIDTKIQSLSFVDLGMSGHLATPDVAPSSPTKQPVVQKQIIKVSATNKVMSDKSIIKPVASIKRQSEFSVNPTKEDKPKLIPTTAKPSLIKPTSENNSSASISSNNEGKSDSISTSNKNNADQAGGSLVVPKDYQGGYLAALRPVYPPESMNNGEEGVVGITVSVSADGKPLDVAISKSSGFSRLDRSAKQAVLKYRFKPATRGGIPIPYKYHFNVAFRMPN